MTVAAVTASAADVQALHARPDWWVRRRVGAVWGLLYFNVLAFNGASILGIPRPVAQLLTMSALGAALLLVLDLNRPLAVRPSVLLGLYTALVVVALMTSVRGDAGIGAVVRSVRLGAFVLVLWLLTPYWARRDMLLARCHLRSSAAVCAVVGLGILVSPGAALGGPNGRLIGIIWPMPGPQVGEYAAITAGMAIVLWLSGRLAASRALPLGAAGVAMVLLSQTRTALIAFGGALACAAVTLVLARRRARRAVTAAMVLTPLAAAALAPAFLRWYQRDQTAQEISTLTGRRVVWERLVDEPRPVFDRWFGAGLSDKSFDGLAIDSSWYAAYHEEGLIGVAIIGAVVLFLLVAPFFQRAGPERALAVFLIVYCVIASYTEVGLADASPYMLHVVVAASLVASLSHRGAVGD